jgi:hypothetical protein
VIFQRLVSIEAKQRAAEFAGEFAAEFQASAAELQGKFGCTVFVRVFPSVRSIEDE